MADGRQRYWLIWVDDTPVDTETPLTADQVAEAFTHAAADPDTVVEVKQCTREDLDWAGGRYADDGIGSDEMED